jgi:hypothetical protein
MKIKGKYLIAIDGENENILEHNFTRRFKELAQFNL